MTKIKKRWIWIVTGLTAVTGGGVCVWRAEPPPGAAFGGALEQASMKTSLLAGGQGVVFSAPGVTEPRSRSVQIVSELSGTLKSISVQAGERVQRGQLVAELDHSLQQAQADLAEASLARAEAELARVKNGERPEDIAVLQANVDEAEARRKFAEFEATRVERMVKKEAVSERELAQARSSRDQALAQEQAARKRLEMARAGARVEDVRRGEAAVSEARAQLASAKAVLEKTFIRSPIDGMVIYRHREPGEAVFTDTPTPILSVGDRRVLHVRVDVDETDIERVWPGQMVFAQASAFGDRRFAGRVVHVEPTLGRKNFRTARPTEKVDTRIQEVVVALEDADDVPLELQMDVWFLSEPERLGKAGADSLAAR